MAEVVEVVELPVLASGFAFACHVDGRHRHGPMRGVNLLAFFCNCVKCCEGRSQIARENGWRYPPELLGMIGVRIGPTDRGGQRASRGVS